MKSVMSTILTVCIVSCGADITQSQDAKAELIVSYPEMARCFDSLEEGLISEKTFKQCLEHTSNHTITLDVDGNIVDMLPGQEAQSAVEGVIND